MAQPTSVVTNTTGMLHGITVTNVLTGDRLDLDMSNPLKSGFAVASVQGLNPVKATINATDMASGDGAIYSASRISSRNIVITLMLLPTDCTVEEQRVKTYKYFPVKKNISLEFKMGSKNVKINGYVESNEVNIFASQKGYQTCNISIICTEPYFVDVDNDARIEFSATDKQFEFPFSNDAILTNENTIIFGEVSNTMAGSIVYTGDAETGMVMTILLSTAVRNLAITSANYGGVLAFDDDIIQTATGNKFMRGDVIVLNTNRGSKSVMLHRGNKTYNILNCLGKNVSWPQLISGENTFVVDASEGKAGIEVTITAPILYSGV